MAGRQDIMAGRAYIELALKNANFVSGLKAGGQQLQAFGGRMMLMGAAVTAAGLALKGMLTAALVHFADFGDELAKMSKRTGIAASVLAELGYAAEQSGQSLETVETSVKKMQKFLLAAAEGSEQQRRALAQLGVSYGEIAGLKPDEQFQRIADGLAAVVDPTIRAGLAMQVFGKSGTALLPMVGTLRQLRKEARDLGLAPSEKDISAAERVHDAFKKIHAIVGMVVFNIGAALAPAFETLSKTIVSTLVSVNNWVKENRALFTTLSLLATATIAAGLALTGFGLAVKGVGIGLSVFAAALSLGVGLIEALVTPLGLVVVAIGGAVAAWLRFTAAGEASVATIRGVLGELAATASQTFSGIADAIAAGDLLLAGRVLMAGLKLAMAEGWDAIKTVSGAAWDWIKGAFQASGAFVMNVFDAMWTNIQNTAATAWGAIQSIWVDAQTAVGVGFANFSQFLGSAFVSVLTGMQNVWMTTWGAIRKFFAETVDALLKKLADFVQAVPGAHEALVAFLGTDERDWAAATEQSKKSANDYLKARDDMLKHADETQKGMADQTANTIASLRQRQADAAAMKDVNAANNQRNLDYRDRALDRVRDAQAGPAAAAGGPSDAVKAAQDDLDAARKAAADAAAKAKQAAAAQAAGAVPAVGEIGAAKQDTFGTFSGAALAASGGGQNPMHQTLKDILRNADAQTKQLIMIQSFFPPEMRTAFRNLALT